MENTQLTKLEKMLIRDFRRIDTRGQWMAIMNIMDSLKYFQWKKEKQPNKNIESKTNKPRLKVIVTERTYKCQ